MVQWGEAVGGVEVAAADRGSGGSGRAVRGINDVTQRRICSPLSFIRKEKEGAVQRGTKERGNPCLLDFRGVSESRPHAE